MAVDLLDAPLRVSWDFFSDSGESLSTAELLKIAAELATAGVFFVNLENRPLAHPAIVPVLETLLAGGCQVSLVTTGAAEQIDQLVMLPAGVQLWFDCACCVADQRLDLQQLAAITERLRCLQFEPALLWLPRAGQLSLIPHFIRFCEKNGVSRFKLPNQKITANSESCSSKLLPDSDDLQQFAALLKKDGLPQTTALQLEVHDLFLWELLQPLCGGERSEYGGCQAANSLGHIDHRGQLLPCAAWPQSLGSLLESELFDLWQSAARLTVRDQIACVPAGCVGCDDHPICFGGCRGLSRFCQTDGSGRDLLCAERRGKISRE